MFNSFGNILKFTSWGESHGKAIGVVVDGFPSQVELSEKDIQPYLDKRKPAGSKFTSQRGEEDRVEILSGVFEGKTTGAPISAIIYNNDSKSADYDDIKDKFRPNHADFVLQEKFGHRDYRGGGRSSARETASRVVAGSIARKLLNPDLKFKSAIIQLGELKAKIRDFDFAATNPLYCPDPASLAEWEEYLLTVRKGGSSVGAIIEIQIENVESGLGEPTYKKLDAEIASAIMGINAVKAVEIGEGFGSASLRGEEMADQMRSSKQFLSNHSGGIIGGISTTQPIVVRFAVKPTSSILLPLKTIDANGGEVEITTKGRHDPCIGIRAIPVAESMLAFVLADFSLMKKIRVK